MVGVIGFVILGNGILNVLFPAYYLLVYRREGPAELGLTTHRLWLALGLTHHIDADVDAERNKLMDDLNQTGFLSGTYWLDGFHEKLNGRNGGGDPYRTDGRLAVGVVAIGYVPLPFDLQEGAEVASVGGHGDARVPSPGIGGSSGCTRTLAPRPGP